jgi:hypothetical protein
MTRYSIPVWRMAKKALIELGGEHRYVPLIDIVNRVRDRWQSENVNEGTIRLQVRTRCVNGHPGHDAFPDRGKMWREQPTFVSNKAGAYRLFDPEKDQDIYKAALVEHEESLYTMTLPKNNKTPGLTREQEKPGQSRKPINDVLGVLEECGQKLGLKTEREWPIPMGRIDLIWYLELPVTLPQAEVNKIPVVGFELETSWRTRKHIKGDILNLQTISLPVGIIIQQTTERDDPQKVKNLIKNTLAYIKESGRSSIAIWTDREVRSLASTLEVLID